MPLNPTSLPPSDRLALAWLCRMAAAGCIHENHSAWAAQLMDDARRLQHDAERDMTGGTR